VIPEKNENENECEVENIKKMLLNRAVACRRGSGKGCRNRGQETVREHGAKFEATFDNKRPCGRGEGCSKCENRGQELVVE